MRITVCQLSWQNEKFAQDWNELSKHIKSNQSELLLLPEMPFSPWFSSLRVVNEELWDRSIESHNEWEKKFDKLNVDIIIGTKPIREGDLGKKYNVGYIWTKNGKVKNIHKKVYLPNEEGFWEDTWYDKGPSTFEVAKVKDIKFGFLICTEIWFMKHAREYGQQGIHFLLTPRSTPIETVNKWVNGGKTAAVISGAYSISSNHYGIAKDGKTILGGAGWISDPEGNLLGKTSENQKFITIEIDIEFADRSKLTYPRYVNAS